jgi:hypothetical protein
MANGKIWPGPYAIMKMQLGRRSSADLLAYLFQSSIIFVLRLDQPAFIGFHPFVTIK